VAPEVVSRDFEGPFGAVTECGEFDRGRCGRKRRERTERSQSNPPVFCCGRKKRKKTKERSGSTCWMDGARRLLQATTPCNSPCNILSFRSAVVKRPSPAPGRSPQITRRNPKPRIGGLTLLAALTTDATDATDQERKVHCRGCFEFVGTSERPRCAREFKPPAN
jgi:hypothetical protein